MADLSLHIVQVDGVYKVLIAGEVDLDTVWRLHEAFGRLDGQIEVDCAEIEFINCAGLHAFAELSQHCDSVMLKNVRPMFQRLLDIVGVSFNGPTQRTGVPALASS